MIKKLLKHGFLFFLSKSMVLIAPLLAAYLLSKESYGLFEWSLSMAMIVSMVATVGAGNTIAFEKVKKERSPLINIGQMYSAYLGLVMAVLSLILFVIFNDARIGLVAGISSFLIIQYAQSAYMKASGLGAWASVADSGIYIILFILLSITWLMNKTELAYPISYSIFSIFFAVYLYKSVEYLSVSKKDIIRFFKRGFPIMLSGGVVILFFNLPKVILGNVSMALVGDFSLYLRWASLALIVYQFIIVVFFKNIYSKTFDEFDKFIGSIVLAVYLLGFLILLLLYLLNKEHINYLPLPEYNFSIQSIFVAIIELWALTASLEGLLYREDKSIHQMWANILGITVFLLYSCFIKNIDNIYAISFGWLIGFISIIIYQLYIIYTLISQKQFIVINIILVFNIALNYIFYNIGTK